MSATTIRPASVAPGSWQRPRLQCGKGHREVSLHARAQRLSGVRAQAGGPIRGHDGAPLLAMGVDPGDGLGRPTLRRPIQPTAEEGVDCHIALAQLGESTFAVDRQLEPLPG